MNLNWGTEMRKAHWGGGTCVVAIPSREGLVICADRLITDDDDQALGDESKIHVCPRGAFVITGKAAFGITASGRDLFDAVQITERYLDGKILEQINWHEY